MKTNSSLTQNPGQAVPFEREYYDLPVKSTPLAALSTICYTNLQPGFSLRPIVIAVTETSRTGHGKIEVEISLVTYLFLADLRPRPRVQNAESPCRIPNQVRKFLTCCGNSKQGKTMLQTRLELKKNQLQMWRQVGREPPSGIADRK